MRNKALVVIDIQNDITKNYTGIIAKVSGKTLKDHVWFGDSKGV